MYIIIYMDIILLEMFQLLFYKINYIIDFLIKNYNVGLILNFILHIAVP